MADAISVGEVSEGKAAVKHSRFTALFERLSIDVLLGCQNETEAKELLKLSWDEVPLIPGGGKL